jgi:uncharacterized protein
MAGYFLDTSAIAKLYHQEPGSDFIERLVAVPDSRPIVSRLSLVEIESVIAIKVRTGALDAAGQDLFRRRLRADFSQRRLRIAPAIEERHYQLARRLLVRFGADLGLRTLDSLQLAVALDLREMGLASVLVAADQRLCRVASAMGCPAMDPCNPDIIL